MSLDKKILIYYWQCYIPSFNNATESLVPEHQATAGERENNGDDSKHLNLSLQC